MSALRLERAGGITDPRLAGGDVAENDGPRPHDRPGADTDAGKDRRTSADVGSGPHEDAAGEVGAR
jgi:hypothetical protein